MKVMKSISLLLIVGLIMMGACGCMNHQDYAEKLLAELENKYSKSFEIVKLSYEVDGQSGNYYRAVCKEPASENTFVAYYYLRGSDYFLSDVLDEDLYVTKDEPLLVDYYPNLLLNLKVADSLVDDIEGVLFVVADIGAFGYSFTINDVEKGIEHCISNDDFDVQSKLYLFASTSIENKEQFEGEVVQKILSMKAYNQSIDIAYISESNLQEVKREYQDDIFMIENRLKHDEKVIRYSWYYAELGQGIVTKKDVKGV